MSDQEQAPPYENIGKAWAKVLSMPSPEIDLIKQDLMYYRDRVSHVPEDSHSTAFAEGQRALAVAILTLAERFK
tara:strand:+ start:354 stop:575 length:222 start_codon:yes stop_codon:yes gene_type:complete